MRIALPVHGITLTLNESGGKIVSDLQEECPYCGIVDCYYNCDASQAEYLTDSQKDQNHEEVQQRLKHNIAMDGIESLILALACSNPEIDWTKPSILEAIETAVDACSCR